MIEYLLDYLILILLGVLLALKMIPKEVMTECRKHSQEMLQQSKPVNRIAANIIIAKWISFAAIAVGFMQPYLSVKFVFMSYCHIKFCLIFSFGQIKYRIEHYGLHETFFDPLDRTFIFPVDGNILDGKLVF